MLSLHSTLGAIVVIYGITHAASYGIWEWKHQNKAGACMVLLLACAALLLPVYVFIIKI
ncbi:MAG TPA: hypothetical protein VHS59_10415 [Bacillota bacterium]|nr:hypothetical protein [Bacillota bacterium]